MPRVRAAAWILLAGPLLGCGAAKTQQCNSSVSGFQAAKGTTPLGVTPTGCPSEKDGALVIPVSSSTLGTVQIDAANSAVAQYAVGQYSCGADLHAIGLDNGAPDPRVWTDPYFRDSVADGHCALNVQQAKSSGRLQGEFSGHLCRDAVDGGSPQCLNVQFGFDFDTSYARR